MSSFTAEEIVAEGRLAREEIETIKRWNRESGEVPELSEESVACFILSCDRDLEFTKKTIGEYFSVRRYARELFDGRDLDRPDLQSQLAALEYIEIPKRTRDGSVVVYHKLHDSSFWKYNMEASMKILFMTIDAALHRYPPSGLIFLFDMKGVNLMHLTRVKLGNIRAFFHYCQEGLPVKLKSIHVLNTVYFLDKVMAIIKPFMKKELYEMLHFHPTNIPMEKFYELHVEKACLPSEYGGDLKTTQILHAENTKYLKSLKEFFEEEEKTRTAFFKS